MAEADYGKGLPHKRNLFVYGVVIAAASVGAAVIAGTIAAVIIADDEFVRKQPLRITACTLDDWADNESCDGFVDPDGPENSGAVFVAGDIISVTGQVCVAEPDVPYVVEVDLLSLDGRGVHVLGEPIPITWTSPCEPPYGFPDPVEWVLPAEIFEGASPGDDLGRWRIVGTASPVDDDNFAPYQWDSVKTFRIIAG